jgi:fatty-acyl-CoA synthase
MMSAARVSAGMASPELVQTLRAAAAGLNIGMVGTPEEFYNLSHNGGALRPFDKNDPCYVQYSSGSTTQPRGVLVTQRAITSNASAIGQFGLQLKPGDRATSWLPLYHDMGLVGFCITPMLSQVSIDYLATSTFALRPRTWLKVISDHGGTISFSPTFGYELCVRRAAKGNGGGFDLSHWRIAGVGGDMVRADVLDSFSSTFANSGFDRNAFVPSYGLAEATLAVSFTPIGEGLRVDRVDRDSYERTSQAVPARNSGTARKTRSFVLCGPAMPGYDIEIRSDSDQPLPERTIGRVCINGPSLMEGYFRNPEATQAVMIADGWLDTGDMGYMVNGELVVTGRRKDMIICNGRNIWPQDLEWSVENVSGIRSGCAAAFSVAEEGNEERVVVVVECYINEPETQRALIKEVVATIHKSAGIHCEVVLVPPRSLVYTSSGKLSRAAAKQQYLDGTIRCVHADLENSRLTLAERPRLAASAGA